MLVGLDCMRQRKVSAIELVYQIGDRKYLTLLLTSWYILPLVQYPLVCLTSV